MRPLFHERQIKARRLSFRGPLLLLCLLLFAARCVSDDSAPADSPETVSDTTPSEPDIGASHDVPEIALDTTEDPQDTPGAPDIPDTAPSDAEDIAPEDIAPEDIAPDHHQWEDETVTPDARLDVHDTEEDTAAPEKDWLYRRLRITLDDPIEVGNRLRAPIDGVSFGFDESQRRLVTAFDHDSTEPHAAFIWLLDEETAIHERVYLEGQPFAPETEFCMENNWCQFIGFDTGREEFVVLGPRSETIMWVGDDLSANQTATSGTRPPAISSDFSSLFAWEVGRLLVYGFNSDSGYSSSLFELDLGTGIWSEATTELAPILNNCLAYDSNRDHLYSFGGVTREELEDESEPLGQYTVYSRSDGQADTNPLPEELAQRQNMSCVFDPDSDRIYLFGGAVINSRWNEALNDYHNDLWALDTTNAQWTQLVADGPTGEVAPGTGRFVAEPRLPNFGSHKGQMKLDSTRSRLLLMGFVPGLMNQLYVLDLADLADLTYPVDPTEWER